MALPERPWHVGEKGGMAGPFYSLVNSEGRVVAMQIPEREVAEFLATATHEPIERSRENPFIVLESLGECAGSMWSALARAGIETGLAGERPRFPVGSAGYYLEAIEDKTQRLFQTLARLLPANYAWSEGDE